MRSRPPWPSRLEYCGLDAGDDLVHRRVEPVQERRRVDADPHRQDDQRHERHHLAEIQVLQVLVLRILDLPEHRPLVEPQHVGRAQHDAAGGDGRPHLADGEDALEDQELADEPVEGRQADRRQHHHAEDRRVDRHHLRQPAVLRDLPGVPPLVDDADDQEERAGRDAVVDLLDDAALDAHRVEGEHAQHDERHVADRRVGDQPLPVALRHGDQRAVDDADDRQRRDHRDERPRRVGQDRQAEPDEPVRPHLQEDGRQDDRAGRRRVGVRVGQPGVEREHRHLDREAQEEGQEHPPLQAGVEAVLLELDDVEGVLPGLRVGVVVVQRQDAEQHHDAADQGVQEELDGRVEPAVAAPDADQEVHRDQHHLPEQEEQQEVERHEGADHPGLEEEQEDVVLLHPLGDRRPRRQDGDDAHQRRQQDHQRREAVHAEVVPGADRRDPRRALHELVRRVGDVVGRTRAAATPGSRPSRRGWRSSGWRSRCACSRTSAPRRRPAA